MNKIILMGRLTREPEIRYSNAAEPMAIARYTLAVDRNISREKRDAGEQAADFINITALGHRAEFAEKWFKKGQMVSVVGRLQIRSFDNEQGQRQWFTEVLVEEQHFAESRASFESRATNEYSQPAQQPAQPRQATPPQPAAPPQQPPSDSFFEIDATVDDDDLPF